MLYCPEVFRGTESSWRVVCVGEAESAGLRADFVALGQVPFTHRKMPATCSLSPVVYFAEAITVGVIFQVVASTAHSATCSTTEAVPNTSGKVALYPLSPKEILKRSSRTTKEQPKVGGKSGLYKDIRFAVVTCR